MRVSSESYKSQSFKPHLNVQHSLQTNTKPKIRCAIYTRKSSEEGLEQEFNSLAAQRLSAENFIASQVHEGWVLLPDCYDDGGISGGTLKRFGVQRLFQDIRDRKIDNVVVYKGDRLFRSLFDFVGTMRLFDEHKVGFVSVTENFNTKTPSGRMHLNMLMSFAQYEREITAERIRDKVDASKRKGMWMGGNPPMGYDNQDKKLVINPEEAKVVKNLFNIFIETESVTEVARELNKGHYTTKSWATKSGKVMIGRRFNKENVRRILENPIYAGKIKHKDNVYDGLHQAIITEEAWQKVKNILSTNQNNQVFIPKTRITVAPLLKGIMICEDCGSRMIPTYTGKKGKRYRYYICSAKVVGNNDSCVVGRIAASELESVVVKQILNLLKKPEFIVQAISHATNNFDESTITNSFKQIERIWDELFPIEQARIISLLIKEITINPKRLTIKIFRKGLSSLSYELVGDPKNNHAVDEETLDVFVPLEIKKRGGTAMVITPKNIRREDSQKCFDEKFIKAIAKAHKWKIMLDEGQASSFVEIAQQEKVTPGYVRKIFDLNFLSPKIIDSILSGTQPRTLKLQDITSVKELPALWQEQVEGLGFGGALVRII